MSQSSYSSNMPVAFVGMKADSGFDDVLSRQATEIVPIGVGVVKNIGYDNKCRLPAANQGSLVFAGDLVTSNVVNLKINGDAITPVTFGTDHVTTMGLLAVEIASHDDVATCVLDATDVSNRTLIVTANDGEDIAITNIVVTLGVGQTTGTFTQGTHDIIEGISINPSAIEQTSAGVVEYDSTEAVSVMHKGRIYGYTEEAVTSDDAVYCRFLANGTGKTPGQFRNDADSGKCLLVSNAKFKSSVTAAGPVVIEVS